VRTMVKPGINMIDNYLDSFKGKRIGLITNSTGVDMNLRPSIDILNEKTNLVALFSPEHGVRGDLQAGEHLDTYIDPLTGITVYSLYGATRKPTKEMMDKLDVLAFDIQGVGARFYTYLYTMAYAMMACKEERKKMVVFDRPNPVNGVEVEGNILDIEYRSFVGYYPIPQRFGLTIGELACFFNEEFDIHCDLEIIKMDGYNRKMDYSDTGLHWVIPSPNIPYVETPYYFLATCIFEGTNLSEGRGTAKPFHMIGSPYLKSELIIKEIKKYKLEGVLFRGCYFTPTFSKNQGKLCHGIELIITDKSKFKPVKTGYTLLYLIRKHHEEFDLIPPFTAGGRDFIDLLAGDSKLKENKISLEELLSGMDQDAKQFEQKKRRYHLYD